MNTKLILFFSAITAASVNLAQDSGSNLGSITGNIQTNAQYYTEDTLIGAQQPKEKMGMISFANINYNRENFRAGMRYESYLIPTLGYPAGFNGSGIGYRYAGWKKEGLDITVGNFYDQFGTGTILRAYEERNLGIDNAFDGVNLKYNPYKGIYLKGLVGKQRYQFNEKLINGNGLVRGFDGEINFNELLDSALIDSKLQITIGGSFVSKFNDDNKTDKLILPKNIGAYGGRITMRYGKFRFFGEYILKENDPYPDDQDVLHNYIYKNGEGIMLNLGYSTKGLGIDLSAKHNDNILWRSTNVTVAPTSLLIGYLPALTKQHTYALASTLYPYATNARGEVAFQADVIYKLPKNSKLGGKYGTSINANFATAYAPKREYLNDLDGARQSYKTTPFAISDSIFLQDFNLSISRKFSKKIKATVTYFNFIFDDRAILVAQNHVMINAQIFVGDVTWYINKKHSVRFEAQHLSTALNEKGEKQDQGNWMFGLIEYSISPNWFFAILDQYNYGNNNPDKQLHYILGSAGFIKGPHRFALQYGKQRAGVFCVGGVCRAVPASNGLTFTVTSSF